MTFRSRLLAGALVVTIVPLTAVAILVRGEMRQAVSELEDRRVAEDGARASEALDAALRDLNRRLAGLVEQLRQANGVRMALQGRMPPAILVQWPANVLSGTGLDAFWLMDAEGRILASAHAPQDTGLVAAGWDAVRSGESVVADLVREGEGLRVVAQSQSVDLDGRILRVVAGRAMARMTAGLERGTVAVGFRERITDSTGFVRVIAVPVIRLGERSDGAFVLTTDPAALGSTQNRMDRAFVLVGGGAVLLAVLAAVLLARSVSTPLERLADQTSRLDLERLAIEVHLDRSDEIGQLERTLAALVTRLRTSVATLRDAERRATVGDVARQVNHDIKNGLVPIRNVLRHLIETAEREPGRTAAVLQERRGTLEASVTYLEQLAANYAKLSPAVTGGRADLGAIVRVAVDAARRDGLTWHTDVRGSVVVAGDQVALRRVVENLVGNARDAAHGAVRVTCAGSDGSVALEVADDGPGMTAEQLDRAFAGFHTTKPGGTGLGLTVVRRLVQDLGGSLKVETEPGRGTTVRVEFPAA